MIKKLFKNTLVFMLCFSGISSLSHAEKIRFFHNGNEINGHYLKPKKGRDAKAVLLFVHGDGPMPHDAHGYYDILWNVLRKKGYAIFSWDKPGVGESQGNWLSQSMRDRQNETLAAIDFIQKHYGFTAKNTGLVGFSQAGWVVPAIASDRNKIGFAVGIGFATNWVEQGEYYSVRKSKLAGETEVQTLAAIRTYEKNIAFFETSPTYSEYLNYEINEPMSQERFEFVLKNYQGDATNDYRKLQVPILLLWGSDDQNVDALHEYQLRLDNHNAFITSQIIADASHGLLDSKVFKGQQVGLGDWLKLVWKGKKAFAEGSIESMVNWLEDHIDK